MTDRLILSYLRLPISWEKNMTRLAVLMNLSRCTRHSCSSLSVRPSRGGSICWQVGHHVSKNVEIPLDALIYGIFAKSESLKLRNRIVWTFGHGEHCRRRFSGRHETVLWFTKGDGYHFDLDAI